MPEHEIRFTHHARFVIDQRQLDDQLIERAVRAPDWVEQDPNSEHVERRFAKDQTSNKTLRVACVEHDDYILIITAFFDRDAKDPR